MKKVLVGIDGSPGAMKAVEHVARLLGGTSDLRITLFHVLPNLPAKFWDDGHILTQGEKEARKQVVDTWVANQKVMIEPVFKKAAETLAKSGMSPQQIETKSISDSLDVADSILEEAQKGYQMLVLGRHGHTPTERVIVGSITSKIVNHGAGIPVCVVE